MKKKKKHRGVYGMKDQMKTIAGRMRSTANALLNTREFCSGQALNADLDELDPVVESLQETAPAEIAPTDNHEEDTQA